MNRRNFLTGGAGALALSTTGCKFDWLTELKKEYPNVLMLIVDDLNDWVGPLGGHPNTKTPNIDRLAAQGTVFTNAHAPAPLCGPSRASIMTGLAPSSTGIYGHVHDNDIKSANDKAAHSIFISDYFRQNGYYTAAVGKVFHERVADNSFDVYGGRVNNFGPYPEKRMKWHDPRTNTDWGAFPEKDSQMPDYDSAQWLAKQLQTAHDKPFFIVGGFLRPHVPWHVPQKWFDMHPVEGLALPPYFKEDLDDVPDIAKRVSELPMMPTTEWAIENGEWRNMVQAYLASVSFVDSCVGIVLDALEKSEYANNTAVVLWGDHGYQLGEKSKFAKMALWERATRTPLIIKPPKSQSKQVSNRPVSLLDLYPTLIKMCGLPPNLAVQGNDITPLLSKPDASWEHAAVTTYGPNNHAVRTERYRYISYEDGTEELYDHKMDGNEWVNLANDAKYTQLKQNIRKYLPSENASWSPVSYYDGNPYFDELTKKAQANTN
ncbi:MAG: sulfatase [Paraglaciecola sp.]|uniref:sulfatase n=1 Tax=Paraglaciecola sp. TaxID=1920173 RepID=UPI00273DDB1B|nr:sulfatase [Paraglaciecola sp.]MDP5029045.1 sulfatase [Paraglaciecola sp.]MDP5130615.1 sulfatase [Paraglaciecola sp.]